jgi:hypothetical protein
VGEKMVMAVVMTGRRGVISEEEIQGVQNEMTIIIWLNFVGNKICLLCCSVSEVTANEGK